MLCLESTLVLLELVHKDSVLFVRTSVCVALVSEVDFLKTGVS